MTIDPITASLLSAIGALVTAVLALWRRTEALHEARNADRAKASQVIFALLQQRRDDRGESPPPTLSEWDDEPTTQVTEQRFKEATAHAEAELNGDVEKLVKSYLSSTPTPSAPKRPPDP